MKGTHLGEFEELVLLMIAVLYDNAYGVAIQKELQSRCNRSSTISTIHSTLKRLEKKGFVVSRYDGATPERGGRRKHLFRVTTAGEKALTEAKTMRNQLWDSIPPLAFNE